MTPKTLLHTAIRPALLLLPVKMTSAAAEAMLIAIAWQESRMTHRRQIHGPARGYWQFEAGNEASRGGVWGVIHHPKTHAHITRILAELDYSTDHVYVTRASEYDAVLAAALARLLLYTVPQSLPTSPAEGWKQYEWAWRPGKPHPATWEQAWQVGNTGTVAV